MLNADFKGIHLRQWGYCLLLNIIPIMVCLKLRQILLNSDWVKIVGDIGVGSRH